MRLRYEHTCQIVSEANVTATAYFARAPRHLPAFQVYPNQKSTCGVHYISLSSVTRLLTGGQEESSFFQLYNMVSSPPLSLPIYTRVSLTLENVYDGDEDKGESSTYQHAFAPLAPADANANENDDDESDEEIDEARIFITYDQLYPVILAISRLMFPDIELPEYEMLVTGDLCCMLNAVERRIVHEHQEDKKPLPRQRVLQYQKDSVTAVAHFLHTGLFRQTRTAVLVLDRQPAKEDVSDRALEETFRLHAEARPWPLVAATFEGDMIYRRAPTRFRLGRSKVIQTCQLFSSVQEDVKRLQSEIQLLNEEEEKENAIKAEEEKRVSEAKRILEVRRAKKRAKKYANKQRRRERAAAADSNRSEIVEEAEDVIEEAEADETVENEEEIPTAEQDEDDEHNQQDNLTSDGHNDDVGTTTTSEELPITNMMQQLSTGNDDIVIHLDEDDKDDDGRMSHISSTGSSILSAYAIPFASAMNSNTISFSADAVEFVPSPYPVYAPKEQPPIQYEHDDETIMEKHDHVCCPCVQKLLSQMHLYYRMN